MLWKAPQLSLSHRWLAWAGADTTAHQGRPRKADASCNQKTLGCNISLIFGVRIKLIFHPVKEFKYFVTERQQLAGKRPSNLIMKEPDLWWGSTVGLRPKADVRGGKINVTTTHYFRPYYFKVIVLAQLTSSIVTLSSWANQPMPRWTVFSSIWVSRINFATVVGPCLSRECLRSYQWYLTCYFLTSWIQLWSAIPVITQPPADIR